MRVSVLAATSLIVLAGSASIALAGPSCSGVFTYTGSIDTCTVPDTGDYSITAYGAQGGSGNSGAGGLGAEVAADISLNLSYG